MGREGKSTIADYVSFETPNRSQSSDHHPMVSMRRADVGMIDRMVRMGEPCIKFIHRPLSNPSMATIICSQREREGERESYWLLYDGRTNQGILPSPDPRHSIQRATQQIIGSTSHQPIKRVESKSIDRWSSCLLAWASGMGTWFRMAGRERWMEG